MINGFSVLAFIILIAIAIHQMKRPFLILRDYIRVIRSTKQFKKFRKSI